jgi:cyclophilin family peptidyl-prolyl cis-trans isomerase
MNKTVVGISLLVLLIIGSFLWKPSKPVQPSDAPKEEQMGAKPTNEVRGSETQGKTYSQPPVMSIDTAKSYTAVLSTSKGEMRVVLNAKEAPVTVNNFVFLSRDGYYTDTPFHRIIKGFMIQGGDPTGTGRGGPGYKFNDEPITADYKKGTIAMANSGPNTNGSQFFLMHADYPLPKNYVIFGAIDPKDTESLKTLDALATVPVTDNGMGEESKPVEKVTLKSVTIEEK